MSKEVVNSNLVLLKFDNGRIFSVRTDDGTAVELANKLTDWSDVFAREDAAKEITQEINLNVA